MTRFVRSSSRSVLFALVVAGCSSRGPADEVPTTTPLPPEPAADRDAGTNVPAPPSPSEIAPPDVPHGMQGSSTGEVGGTPMRDRAPRLVQVGRDAGAGIGTRDSGAGPGTGARDAGALGGVDAGSPR